MATSCGTIRSSRCDPRQTQFTFTKQWAPPLFRLTSRSIPPEQPIFEIERHPAKSHCCEPKKAIEIILRIGVDIGDCHVACPEITLFERHLSGKPPDMSPSTSSGGY